MTRQTSGKGAHGSGADTQTTVYTYDSKIRDVDVHGLSSRAPRARAARMPGRATAMGIEIHTNPTQVSGVLVFAMAALACARRAIRHRGAWRVLLAASLTSSVFTISNW